MEGKDQLFILPIIHTRGRSIAELKVLQCSQGRLSATSNLIFLFLPINTKVLFQLVPDSCLCHTNRDSPFIEHLTIPRNLDKPDCGDPESGPPTCGRGAT